MLQRPIPVAVVLKVTFSLGQQPLTGLGAKASQGLESGGEKNLEFRMTRYKLYKHTRTFPGNTLFELYYRFKIVQDSHPHFRE